MNKVAIRIKRSRKVDSYMNGVKQIENYMQSISNNINSTVTEAQKLIFGSANLKIMPKKIDIDPNIVKYTVILKAYSNPNDSNFINIITTLFHWGTFATFNYSFFMLNGGINLNSYTMVSFASIPTFLVICIILQELLAKNNVSKIHEKVRYVAGISTILSILGIMIYFYFISKQSILYGTNTYFNNANDVFSKFIITFLPFIIYAGFLYAIFHFCKISGMMHSIFKIISVLCFYAVLYGFIVVHVPLN
jgi:hypothetical protein